MDGAMQISCSQLKVPISTKLQMFTTHFRFSHNFVSLLKPTSSFPLYPSLTSRFSPPFVQSATPDSQLSVEVSNETSEWAMQDFYTLRKEVESTSTRVEEIVLSAGLQHLEKELAALESKAADSTLWDDRAKAQETLSALTDVKDKLKLLKEFQTQVEEAETIINLTEEMDSIDTALLQEAVGIIKELNKALDRFELTELLSGPYDKEGAVISISAGAGGTDAQCRIGLICFSGCI
ncbi:unnamed protein product [Amaranthus hypochondriacus]